MDRKLGGLILAAAMLALSTPAVGAKGTGDEARFEACRAKLKKASELNLLKGMSFDGGHPRVVIGPTWYRIDFSAKTGLAETAACFFLAGDKKAVITFPIIDNMTGKEVARWKFNKLEVK